MANKKLILTISAKIGFSHNICIASFFSQLIVSHLEYFFTFGVNFAHNIGSFFTFRVDIV